MGGGHTFWSNPKFIGHGDFKVTDARAARVVQMMIELGVVKKQPQSGITIDPV
jgi:hypothetical protein